MELWSLPSLCTRRSFTIAHKSCSCVSHLGTPACPSPCLCHSGSWPLSDTRNQNTERRRGWSWGFSARAEGGGGEGGVDDVWWHLLVLFKGIC